MRRQIRVLNRVLAAAIGGTLLLAAAGCSDISTAEETASNAAPSKPVPAVKTKPEDKVLVQTPGFAAAMKNVPPEIQPKPPASVTHPAKMQAKEPAKSASANPSEAPKDAPGIALAAGNALIAAKAHPKVSVVTSKGTFVIEVDPDGVPYAAGNFIALAVNHFYDGLTFHRVEPGFVIQGGDPKGNGTGGPGYSIPDEDGPLLHVEGAVAWAKSGPNTAGSQWYVTLAPTPELDHKYTVFGKVVSGMDVVKQISVGDVMKKVTVSGLPAGFHAADPAAAAKKAQ